MSKKYRKLPNPVHTLLTQYETFLVGSAAIWYIEESEDPNDFDMIVKPRSIPQVNKFLWDHRRVSDLSVNSMGGMKARFIDGLEIDYWEDTVRGYAKKVRSMGFGRIAVVGLRPKLMLIEDNE